jgi:hypothetical protein
MARLIYTKTATSYRNAVRIGMMLVLSVALLLGPARATHAASFSIPCGDSAALIAAINAANDETANPGPDTIALAAECIYTLTEVDNADTVHGTIGLPRVTSALTIDGNRATIARSTAAGIAEFGIFVVVEGGDLTLDEVTVRNGGRAGYTSSITNMGTLSLVHSEVSGSSSNGIYTQGVLDLEGSIVRDNGGAGVVSEVGNTTIANSNISNNQGIGVLNRQYVVMTLSDSVVRDNYGSGIDNSYFSSLTVIGSTISGNIGALYGGGINSHIATTLAVQASTISGNTAELAGGGIYHDPFGGSVLRVVNSTISDNRAAEGGGIYAQPFTASDAPAYVISNSTISANHGGGIRGMVGTLLNTIIAAQASGPDCSEPFISGSLGHTLDSDGSCDLSSPGDLSGVSARLGPLADNGGPTLTHALLPGSPAIDAGDNAGCAAEPVSNLDQRSQLRPIDGNGDGVATCDIGAFEYGDITAPVWAAGSALSASAIGLSTLTLSWTAAADDVGVTGYRIYQDDALLATVPGDIRTYAVAGLAPDILHSFKVEAGDAAGNWSADGPATSARTLAPAQAIQSLIQMVNGLPIGGGIKTALIAPLNSAYALLTDGNPANDTAACANLGSFVAQVDAQRRAGRLTAAQAAALTEAARAVQAAHGC